MGHWGGIGTSAAVDKSGRLYTTGNDLDEIAVWPAGSNGDVKFAAEFFLESCNSFGGPGIPFALDGEGDVWAASFQNNYDGPTSTIFEYPPVPADAKGELTPGIIRTIGGPKNGIQYALSIALNGKGQVSVEDTDGLDAMFNGRILTFGETANRGFALVSRLAGFKTQLGHAGPRGIAYDSQGRLVACSNTLEPKILTFASGAHGNVAPINTLSVPGCSSIALDPNDDIYVAFNNSILVYAAGASGSAQPLRVITGDLTTLSNASSVTL